MENSFYWLILGVLALWRLTHLLHAEDGPWDSMNRLRAAAAQSFWAAVLDCFYCLSLWLALPLALVIGSGFWGRLLLWPALSAGAILLERASAPDPPLIYSEDPPDPGKESENVLRQGQDTAEDPAPHG